MQRNLQLYGPKDAASIWFTGKIATTSLAVKSKTRRPTRLLVARVIGGLQRRTFKPGPAVTAASGAPTVVAGGPAAPAAPFGSAGNLPGFEANSPGAKMTAEGLKTMGFDKGAGGNEQPPSMPAPMQLPPAQAVGGPMMMGAGGQNMQGRLAAMNALQQQGFMMQPSTAAFTPAMPGTTLNSPSQLQMALQSGAMNPFNIYGALASGSF